jgi:acyl-CoA thioester hydrolase
MRPHSFPLRVYFEDTDAGAMAYHATYLRWAERARTEALREAGMPHQEMMELHNAILVVRRVEVEYVRPARLDDLVTLETRVLAVRGATLVLDQRARKDGADLAVMRVELACLDRAELRPRRIPEPWRTAIGGGEAATAPAAVAASPGA